MNSAREMRKNAICSSLRIELERWHDLIAMSTDRAAIRASGLKIQAYCDELDDIERQEQVAA